MKTECPRCHPHRSLYFIVVVATFWGGINIPRSARPREVLHDTADRRTNDGALSPRSAHARSHKKLLYATGQRQHPEPPISDRRSWKFWPPTATSSRPKRAVRRCPQACSRPGMKHGVVPTAQARLEADEEAERRLPELSLMARNFDHDIYRRRRCPRVHESAQLDRAIRACALVR